MSNNSLMDDTTICNKYTKIVNKQKNESMDWIYVDQNWV
jgi:hypothetical protein